MKILNSRPSRKLNKSNKSFSIKKEKKYDNTQDGPSLPTTSQDCKPNILYDDFDEHQPHHEEFSYLSLNGFTEDKYFIIPQQPYTELFPNIRNHESQFD